MTENTKPPPKRNIVVADSAQARRVSASAPSRFRNYD